MHRIDKATAGLVLFAASPSTRQHYHRLFETHRVRKTYQAIASTNNSPPAIGRQWEVKTRLERTGYTILDAYHSGAG